MEEEPSTTEKVTLPTISTTIQSSISTDYHKEWVEKNRREKENIRKRLFIDLLGGMEAFEYTFESFPRKDLVAYQAARVFDPLKDNYYFWGPSFTGKTHLATAMAHKFWDMGNSVYVASIHDFKATLQRLDSEFNFSEKKKFIDYFINADVLVLHELGRGKMSDFIQENMWNILDRRILARRNGLIMTANFSPKEIEQKYGSSIFERIRALCDPHGFIRFPPRSMEVI